MVVVHSGSQWFSVTAVSSSSPSNEGGKDMNARYFLGRFGEDSKGLCFTGGSCHLLIAVQQQMSSRMFMSRSWIW